MSAAVGAALGALVGAALVPESEAWVGAAVGAVFGAALGGSPPSARLRLAERVLRGRSP